MLYLFGNNDKKVLKNKSKWILAELFVIKLHVWNELKGAQF